jgi:GNAT superfamily N-acetyltransferase
VTARAAEVAIRELPVSQLATYAAVPIAFRVTSRLILTGHVTAAEALTEVPVARSFDKDYDAMAGIPPLEWPSRYMVARWGLLVATMEGRVVGGAAVAPAAEVMPSHDVAGGTAVLWDLRVAPEWRGRGVGSALFRASERWAAARGWRAFLVETQDVNVGACRFYARVGCRLESYEPDAYDAMPGEARLIWRAPMTDG